MKTKEKEIGIGIYGGTFDPIHQGHVSAVANIQALSFIKYCMVVPTYNPYYKNVATSNQHRYKMACRVWKPYIVSRAMITNKFLFTYQLIELFREIGIKDKLYLFLGTDYDISTFKNFKYVKKECEIIYIQRYQNGGKEYNWETDSFNKRPSACTKNFPILPLSSTDIRKRLDLGLTIEGLVPDSVVKYISRNRLYAKVKEHSMIVPA
jgi:nicotinate-nucleotide adenylyltransferase